MKTKYKKDFLQVPEYLSKIISFSTQRGIFDETNFGEENGLILNEKIMKIDVLSQLEGSLLVTKYIDNIPKPTKMSEEQNRKYRLLIDDNDVDSVNTFHDQNI